MEATGKKKGLDVAFSAYTPWAQVRCSASQWDRSLHCRCASSLRRPSSGELGKFFDLMSSTDMGADFYKAAVNLNRKIVMDQIVRCVNTNSAM